MHFSIVAAALAAGNSVVNAFPKVLVEKVAQVAPHSNTPVASSTPAFLAENSLTSSSVRNHIFEVLERSNVDVPSIMRKIDDTGLPELMYQTWDLFTGAAPQSDNAQPVLVARQDLGNGIANVINNLIPNLGNLLSIGITILASVDWVSVINLLTSLNWSAIGNLLARINFTAIGELIQTLLSAFGFGGPARLPNTPIPAGPMNPTPTALTLPLENMPLASAMPDFPPADVPAMPPLLLAPSDSVPVPVLML